MRQILIVDDEKIARKGLTEHLALDLDDEEQEYQIDSVGNTNQAINYLTENKRIELVFLDLALPTLQDGFQVLNKINEDSISTRVLVVSCHANKVENSIVGTEIHGFLPKPLNWNKIGQITKDVISQPKINRKIRPKNKKTTREILLSINQLSASERFEIAKIIIKNLSQASKKELIYRIYETIELNKSQGKDPERDPLDLDFDSPEILELCRYKYGRGQLEYNPAPVLRYSDGSKMQSRTLSLDHPAVQKDLQTKNKDLDLELTRKNRSLNKEENKKDKKIQQVKKLLKSEQDAMEILKIILLEYPDILKNMEII